MLLPTHIKFLKLLKTAKPDFGNFAFSYEYLAKISGYSHSQILSICELLHENHCIGLFGEPPKGVWLLETGRYYLKFQFLSHIPFVTTTLLAAVGAVTGIIALVCS